MTRMSAVMAVPSQNIARQPQLAQVVGDPALAENPQYANERDRSLNRKALAAHLETLLATRPGLDWLDELRAAKIPCGPIHNFAQVFADPQVKAVDMVRNLQRSDGSELPLLRGPLRINGSPTPVSKAPPALGEDTRNVLENLGLDTEQIDGLLAAGIVNQAAIPLVEAAGR